MIQMKLVSKVRENDIKEEICVGVSHLLTHQLSF